MQRILPPCPGTGSRPPSFYTGFTAWTVATGYHRFLEGGVRLLLPSLAAEALGWACAAALTWLILQRAWLDLQPGRRRAA